MLPLLFIMFVGLGPALGDYSAPQCADFGGCYMGKFNVHRDACNQAIDWVCGADLSKADYENEQGTGNEKDGNCNAQYATPNLSGPRAGSKQDCVNTFNAILDACGPSGGSGSQGFWGSIGSKNDSEPFFSISSGTNKDAGPNFCTGKGHSPVGSVNTEPQTGPNAPGKAGAALAGSHPGKRQIADIGKTTSQVARRFQA